MKNLIKTFLNSALYTLSTITITVIVVSLFVIIIGEILLKLGIFYAIAALYILIIVGAATMFTISKRKDKTTRESRGKDKYPFN